MSHLLPLSALHAAAPGVLDVVFGPDGTFEGAPAFSPPLWTGIWSDRLEDPICQWGWCWGEVYMSEDGLALFDDHRQVEDAYLDCRVPSVAARLLRLCGHASDTVETVNETEDLVGHLGTHMINIAPWHVEHAVRVAALTLALAPKIAALGGSRV